MGAGGDVLFEDLGAFVDQGQQAALEDFLRADGAARVAEALGLALHQGVHFRVVLGLAAARRVGVVALAGLLAEAAEFAQAVVDLHLGHVLALAGQFAGAPFQVDADHVVHAERAHGEAEALQGGVHLVRVGAFEEHAARLEHVGVEHAVADEAVAVAGHHADLADALAQGQGGVEHGRGGAGAAHDLQQLHDVRRAEEVQAEHVLRALGDSGDGVDVQCRGVAGEDGALLHGAVEGAEDLLLEFEVLVHRLDHQIDPGQRGVVGHRLDARTAQAGLAGADAALGDVLRPGVLGHLQAGLDHLRVVVQP